MILVDTSIWIDHLRQTDQHLSFLLNNGHVLTHPAVIGELACGNIKNRKRFLNLISRLPHAKQATDDEVLFFIENNQLMGKGMGYIDAHLLASTALTQSARLFSKDKRLTKSAKALGLNVVFG